MNILYIDHYAGSARHGMEYRPYYLAREWARLGHDVTIVAASVSHLRQSNPVMRAPVEEEMIDGIRYLWCHTPAYRGNGIGRVINICFFVLRLCGSRLQAMLKGNPDVVIASSTYPLDIYPARRLARRYRAKLVFELHDLWPLTPIEVGGMSRWHPFIMLLQRAEDAFCRDADVVVSMLPNADDHLVLHGMDRHKYCYVPNGVVLEDWHESRRLPEGHRVHLERLRKTGRFLVCYAGWHGQANALDSILDAASTMRDEPVTFVLVGHGPEKAKLIDRGRTMGLENIVFLDPVPKESVPTLLSCFDALYLGFKNQPLYRFGISPNKLMDYMMAAKPVIMALAVGRDPIGESRCGLTIRPEDSDALVAAIHQLLAMSPEELSAMGARGNAFVKERHDYRVLARTFLECLARCG
jgi:glycosyltransferase involved in cell wall biosynthesis